jgi:hypothetical protein
VNLYGDLAQPEITCHLLVHLARRDEPHDLPFPRRQGGQPLAQEAVGGIRGTPGRIAGNRRRDRVKHVLVAEGFGEEIDRLARRSASPFGYNASGATPTSIASRSMMRLHVTSRAYIGRQRQDIDR